VKTTDLHGVCDGPALRSTPPSQAKAKVVPSESSRVAVSIAGSHTLVWLIVCSARLNSFRREEQRE
jgi:hypothetical protein